MKKKLLVWTLLLLLPVLAACNAAKTAVATEAPAEITQAPAEETEPPAPATPAPVSPIHETDAEGLIKATGIALIAPEGAENAVYSYLQNGQERPTARLKFTLDGVNGWIYAKPYAGFAPPDTAALYQKSAETMVGECRGIVYTREDAGYIAWVDADSGVLYELGLSAGASAEKLTALAGAVYAALGKSGYDAYTELLDRVAQGIRDGWSHESVDDLGISEAFKRVQDLNLGWLRKDINEDGTEELLFGAITEEGEPSPIYDIFTMLDGELVHPATGREINYWLLMRDGTLVNEFTSNGWDRYRTPYGFFNGKLVQTVRQTDTGDFLWLPFQPFPG